MRARHVDVVEKSAGVRLARWSIMTAWRGGELVILASQSRALLSRVSVSDSLFSRAGHREDYNILKKGGHGCAFLDCTTIIDAY